jgi:hypothetical protein
MTNAAVQIDLRQHPLCRPEMVEDCLGITRNRLNALIESGKIAWAWNVGLGSKRRELRILGQSIVEYQGGAIDRIGATKNLNLPGVMALILPKRNEIRGTEIQKILCISADAIRKLHEAGEIKTVSHSAARPTGGPNSSPHFSRKSLVGFFSKRRVP